MTRALSPKVVDIPPLEEVARASSPEVVEIPPPLPPQCRQKLGK